MKRKLFCEVSPLTYEISRRKCIIERSARNLFEYSKFAKMRQSEVLEHVVYRHNSLIRRKLGNVDMQLQENKAVNLSIAATKISKILIRPGEIFSFWYLVGATSAKKGYKEGLTISSGKTGPGVGGGMCQMTNLIHWMILHSDMEIIEHHHHDRYDLFPDYNRKVPFGTGTSIVYNYLDYRFKNTTDRAYQLIVYTTDEYLCGELRSSAPQANKYHIKAENEFFSRENGIVYRNGQIYRIKVDSITGDHIEKKLIRKNHAEVLYDTDYLEIKDIEK